MTAGVLWFSPLRQAMFPAGGGTPVPPVAQPALPGGTAAQPGAGGLPGPVVPPLPMPLQPAPSPSPVPTTPEQPPTGQPSPATPARPLAHGIHLDASRGLVAIGIPADRITQTIGDYAASAGTHIQDGVHQGHPYSGATDISVHEWSDEKIAQVLDQLADHGFAAWYRKPGVDGWNGDPHIHAVYAGAVIKDSLRDQVRSWLEGKNGLRSDTEYSWHRWDEARKQKVRTLFQQHNP